MLDTSVPVVSPHGRKSSPEMSTERANVMRQVAKAECEVGTATLMPLLLLCCQVSTVLYTLQCIF